MIRERRADFVEIQAKDKDVVKYINQRIRNFNLRAGTTKRLISAAKGNVSIHHVEVSLIFILI